MAGKRGTLNGVQRIPEFEINGREILQPFTWYTCPAGKKAIVKGSVVCTNRGAAASTNFLVAGETMFAWDRDTAALGDYLQNPRALTTQFSGQFALFDIELSAGGTVLTQQNVGTNAEFNVFAKVQETPA